MDIIKYMVFVLQKIPYIGAVCGGIKPGMALYVEGMVPANGNQYVLSLSLSQSIDFFF